MSSTYTLFACELTTGRVLGEIPAIGFSGTVRLDGTGEMQFTLNLGAFPEARRRDLLFATTTGRVSIVLDRDGIPVGEWIVWKRKRTNDSAPISLGGTELMSFGATQQIGPVTYVATDQATIAANMAQQIFGPTGAAGSVAVTVETPTPTGVLTNRRYERYEGAIGDKLVELASADNGFDYTVTSQWSMSTGARYIQRTWRLAFPLAGTDRSFAFDQASSRYTLDPDSDTDVIASQGGTILDLSMDEDGRRLASVAYALGAGEGYDKTIGIATNDKLVAQGYPRMVTTGSYSTVNQVSRATALARALLADAQDPTIPPELSIRGDADPGIEDLNLGDRVRVAAEPSINFPDGYRSKVRVLGWTFTPPESGPETIKLLISGEDD